MKQLLIPSILRLLPELFGATPALGVAGESTLTRFYELVFIRAHLPRSSLRRRIRG